jgi:Hemolysins and related proteins containing CBS domains
VFDFPFLFIFLTYNQGGLILMEDIITQILVIAVLILFSAYFSATETAYSSMNKTRLKTIAEKDNKKSKAGT